MPPTIREPRRGGTVTASHVSPLRGSFFHARLLPTVGLRPRLNSVAATRLPNRERFPLMDCTHGHAPSPLRGSPTANGPPSWTAPTAKFRRRYAAPQPRTVPPHGLRPRLNSVAATRLPNRERFPPWDRPRLNSVAATRLYRRDALRFSNASLFSTMQAPFSTLRFGRPL